MITCDYCHGPFEPTRHGQRFCRGKCRSAWHRQNSLPGQVTGIRALKSGWAVTVRYPELPTGIVKGSAIRIETDGTPRPDASQGSQNG